MDISELLKQRKCTRAIAELFSRELSGHLKTIAPLINPRSVFGEHIHGGPRAASPQGGKALASLSAAYEEVSGGKPFDLRKKFETPIALLGTQPEIHPISYQYRAQANGGEKQLLVTCPLKWALSYEGFGLDRLRDALQGKVGHEKHSLQDFVLHSLMLAITIEMKPGIGALFDALRFPITIERHEAFGELPIVVITSPLGTQLPEDQVIVDSTEISGSSDFEEIVDTDPIDGLQDPLREKLQSL